MLSSWLFTPRLLVLVFNGVWVIRSGGWKLETRWGMVNSARSVPLRVYPTHHGVSPHTHTNRCPLSCFQPLLQTPIPINHASFFLTFQWFTLIPRSSDLQQIRHHHVTVWDGPRTRVSDRLPSTHHVTTSAHETVRRGDCCGVVSEGVKKGDQLWVVHRFRRWSLRTVKRWLIIRIKRVGWGGWEDGHTSIITFTYCSKWNPILLGEP
jgi:hypothetical protein